MNKYAENLLSPFELRNYHSKLVQFFGDICKYLYLNMQIEEKRSIQAELRLMLIEYETNIWSCIYRICDLNSVKTERDLKTAAKL